ncbi:venom metalloproteinase BumaMPs1-like [Ornithodoros turicata]|uniref:venom metalloproteinase BumaMPs1-like n=1 Tax=Ornithodoros turicata TaxID=34597 RepID=UPI0031391B62
MSATKSVVFPKLLEGRSEDGRRILAIKDDLQLKLTKSTVFPEQFLYKEYDDGFVIQHHLEGRDLEKNLYHDSERMASLMVSTEGGLQVEGIVGKNLRIRPLTLEQRSSQGDGGHLLYEVEERIPQQGDILHAPDTEFEERASAFTLRHVNVNSRQDQTNYEMPETNPEVLIVVDTAHHKKYTGKRYEKRDKIIQYFGIFVNAVNLKYTTLAFPKVKFVLAGIWRHNATEESEYMKLPASNLINSMASMVNLANYANLKKLEFASFDLVVVVTGRDLVRVHDNGEYSKAEAGRAYVGKVCDERYKVGMAEDFPHTYDGVHTFAHEVGHLMGCYHDGYPSPTPGRPGGENCSASERLIMSPYSSSSDVVRFSYCCALQVWHVYHQDSKDCLKTRSRTTDYIVKKLPGDALKSPDEFCKLEYPQYNETVKSLSNKQLPGCIISCKLKPDDSGYYLYNSPDGMPCEENTTKVCMNKECKEYSEF